MSLQKSRGASDSLKPAVEVPLLQRRLASFLVSASIASVFIFGAAMPRTREGYELLGLMALVFLIMPIMLVVSLIASRLTESYWRKSEHIIGRYGKIAMIIYLFIVSISPLVMNLASVASPMLVYVVARLEGYRR